MENIKLKEISASELLALAEKMEEKEPKFMRNHLANFMPDLGLMETVIFANALDDKNEEQLQNFINIHPELDFNKDGDSEAKEIPAWKVKAEALRTSYAAATSSAGENGLSNVYKNEVVNARTLECIKPYPATEYEKAKNRYLKSHYYSQPVPLETYENELKDKIPYEAFMSKVLCYFNNHAKQTRFIQYVFYYLDILRADTEFEDELSKEYVKTIQEILAI